MSGQNNENGKLDLFLETRQDRGLALFQKVKNSITENDNGSFSVPSARIEEIAYTVKSVDGEYVCNCPDFNFRAIRQFNSCKHIYAVKLWIAAKVELKQEPKPKIFAEDAIQCPKCGSIKVIKFGSSSGKKCFKCKDCTHRFRESNIFKRARYTPEMVSLTLDLYFSGASFRKIARIVGSQFSVKLNSTSIYRWIQKYIPLISEKVNALSPQLSDTWHADEVFVKMHKGIEYRKNKNMAFLWNVMDRKTRFLLASKVSAYRDEFGANQALTEAIKNAHGIKPEQIFTDAHRAYNTPVFDQLRGTWHVAKAGIGKPHNNNNRIERLNGTVRERVKIQRAWKSFTSAIPEGQRIHYNFVRPHQALEGQTPAERAGLTQFSGNKNKWLEMLLATQRKSTTQNETAGVKS